MEQQTLFTPTPSEALTHTVKSPRLWKVTVGLYSCCLLRILDMDKSLLLVLGEKLCGKYYFNCFQTWQPFKTPNIEYPRLSSQMPTKVPRCCVTSTISAHQSWCCRSWTVSPNQTFFISYYRHQDCLIQTQIPKLIRFFVHLWDADDIECHTCDHMFLRGV